MHARLPLKLICSLSTIAKLRAEYDLAKDLFFFDSFGDSEKVHVQQWQLSVAMSEGRSMCQYSMIDINKEVSSVSIMFK